MRLSAREEIVVELFRSLTPSQRNDAVRYMRSAADATREIEKKLGGPYKEAADARVAAKFGPAPIRRTARKLPIAGNKPQPRTPDRNQDDADGVD